MSHGEINKKKLILSLRSALLILLLCVIQLFSPPDREGARVSPLPIKRVQITQLEAARPPYRFGYPARIAQAW